jgi:hypothetical protein
MLLMIGIKNPIRNARNVAREDGIILTKAIF